MCSNSTSYWQLTWSSLVNGWAICLSHFREICIASSVDKLQYESRRFSLNLKQKFSKLWHMRNQINYCQTVLGYSMVLSIKVIVLLNHLATLEIFSIWTWNIFRNSKIRFQFRVKTQVKRKNFIFRKISFAEQEYQSGQGTLFGYGKKGKNVLLQKSQNKNLDPFR